MVNTYIPASLKEALQIRNGENVITFAGGTDLMVRRKSWPGTLPLFDAPVLMVGGLKELKGCRTENGYLKIGAAEKLAGIAENSAVPEILRLAVHGMASPSIRNMGTIGGNIMNASPAGDTLPPLYALNATLTLESQAGSREVPVEKFIFGPGKTEIAANELLTAVNVPVEEYEKACYRKIGTRKADALSKASFAGLAVIGNGRLNDVRIAIGAVAPTVVRSAEAEGLLNGRDLKDIPAVVSDVLEIYAGLIRPIDDQRSTAAYRKQVSLRLIEDFIASLNK
jgi:xanthine dehydrogenase FAD-binding subunit